MVNIQLLAYSSVPDSLAIQTRLSECSLKHVILDLSNIVSAFQICVGIMKSLLSEANGTMKTTDFQSEVMYNLSVSGRITEAIGQFGVKEGVSDIVVAIVHCDGSDTSTGKVTVSTTMLCDGSDTSTGKVTVSTTMLCDDPATAIVVDSIVQPEGAKHKNEVRREDAANLCSSSYSLDVNRLSTLKACYKLTDADIEGQGFDQIEQIIITRISVKNL